MMTETNLLEVWSTVKEGMACVCGATSDGGQGLCIGCEGICEKHRKIF